MIAEPRPTRSVRPASSPSTETASWPHASLIQTESRPSSSAITESETCSSGENQGQYARKSPMRIGPRDYSAVRSAVRASVARNTSTTRASNCAPAQRRSSAAASSIGMPAR